MLLGGVKPFSNRVVLTPPPAGSRSKNIRSGDFDDASLKLISGAGRNASMKLG